MEENIFDNKEVDTYVVQDSRKEQNTFSNSEQVDKRPPGKPCPPGHYIGKGHYPGDNCNCDKPNPTGPSVSIDMGVGYMLGVGVLIILIFKKLIKWTINYSDFS